MKFVHPNILYLLLLLIIPIIIHLFNFRRYKKLYFSSLQFIKKVEKETNATKTLRHYLILAARLLAFASLIFAFAQPYIPTNKNQHSDFQNVIPIYIDNSFSMSAKSANGDLLNQAKTTVRRIVDGYSKDQRYLLVTNSMNGAEFKIISGTTLLDKLQYIKFSPISRAIATPLISMKDYLNQHTSSSHHYYVISDFQSLNLSASSIFLDSNATYSLLQTIPQLKHNLYVDSVWFDQPFHRVNVNNQLKIRIQNTGKEKLTNVEIALIINGKRRQTLTDLLPNNQTIVTINYSDKTSGTKIGKIEIQDPNLYFDNHYFFSYAVEKGVQVAVINGKNSVSFPSMVYATDDYYQVKSFQSTQIQSGNLSSADLIVLNGLKTISSGLQTQMLQLAKEGISICIIPGINFDKNAYNQLLGAFNLPLIANKQASPIRIGKINNNATFFNGMFDQKTNEIRMPPLKKYISTTTFSTTKFRNLISYENEMPFFVNTGQQNSIYMLYTPINPDFNSFGKSALFSSLMLRIGERSILPPALALTIGSTEEWNYRTQGNREQAIQLKKKQFIFIPEMRRNGDFIAISVRKAANNTAIEDGVYTVSEGEQTLGKVALNYNRKESDMKYASKEEIQNYFYALDARHLNTIGINSNNDVQKLTLEKPNELWRILLTLALVFFLIEMLIIIFWKIK